MKSHSRPRHAKVHEEIARDVQDQIRRGDLKPGDQLPPERRLAEMFGASRGSVREALRSLELAGLIRTRQGGGNFVAATLPSTAALPLSRFLDRHREHLMDLSEARQMFEPRLALLAAERASPQDLDEMRRAVEEQERHLRDGNVEAAFEADRAFHQAIALAARNQTFLTLHTHLSDLVSGGEREVIENVARRVQSRVDHRTVYEAIARKDGAAASTAMLRHLRNVEAILLDALQTYRQVIAGTTHGDGSSRPGPDSASR